VVVCDAYALRHHARSAMVDTPSHTRTLRQWKRRSFALIITSPSTGTDTNDLMEGTSERRLIRKARQIRNIGQ
jgi:hypothetical protein